MVKRKTYEVHMQDGGAYITMCKGVTAKEALEFIIDESTYDTYNQIQADESKAKNIPSLLMTSISRFMVIEHKE